MEFLHFWETHWQRRDTVLLENADSQYETINDCESSQPPQFVPTVQKAIWKYLQSESTDENFGSCTYFKF